MICETGNFFLLQRNTCQAADFTEYSRTTQWNFTWTEGRLIHSATFVSFPADHIYLWLRDVLQPDMPVWFSARPAGSVANSNDNLTPVDCVHITLHSLHRAGWFSRYRFWLTLWRSWFRISVCTPPIRTEVFSSLWSVVPRTIQSGNFKQNKTGSLGILILTTDIVWFVHGNGCCVNEFSHVLRTRIILFHQPNNVVTLLVAALLGVPPS